jgi:hypothetical protein
MIRLIPFLPGVELWAMHLFFSSWNASLSDRQSALV